MGMQLIETIEVGSGGAASIEFTSIPQDGVDLLLQLSSANTGTVSRIIYGQFNSDTSNNYAWIYLQGDGASVASSASTPENQFWFGRNSGGNAPANTFGNSSLYVSNYTSSSAKSLSVDAVDENNGTTAYQYLAGNSWAGTSAITSIKIYCSSNSFAQYSTASLYKITAD